MIIGIGSNLFGPDGASPLQQNERAVRAIADLPGVSLLVRSRWFSSAPVPRSAQGRYLNGVVRITCALPPEMLLAALQRIELVAKRERSVRNAARTLDLDIIDAGGKVQDDPDLILPHPRAHLRGFVLYPLRDVAPGWTHPVSGLSVRQLLRALAPEDTSQL